ncbi:MULTISPECIES: SDR family oxidoreductase [unclassified Kribbella]|uniref:SDR family oxidoreductase n=1 Tax=unclassified Kribbella TaxID=2644121 RepID=UPI0033C08D9F
MHDRPGPHRQRPAGRGSRSRAFRSSGRLTASADADGRRRLAVAGRAFACGRSRLGAYEVGRTLRQQTEKAQTAAYGPRFRDDLLASVHRHTASTRRAPDPSDPDDSRRRSHSDDRHQRLTGKTAFVTGGSAGSPTSSSFKDSRRWPCDVSDEDQVMYAVTRTVEEFGSLDMAFNNAGIMLPPADSADETGEAFDRLVAVNLRGVWASMKHELKQIREQGPARS